MARYVVQPARRLVKDSEVQQALDDVHTAILPHTRAQQVNFLTYGTTVTVNLALGNVHVLSATNTQPFQVAKPTGVAVSGLNAHGQVQPNLHWTLVITNDAPPAGTPKSDGIIRPSFDPSLVVAPFTSPAAGGAAVAQFVTIVKGTTVKHYQVGAWSNR